MKAGSLPLYLFLKKAFKNLKKHMNYTSVGGAAFLGIEKLVIKTHGSSKAETIFSCVQQVKALAESNMIDNLKSGLQCLNKEGEVNE